MRNKTKGQNTFVQTIFMAFVIGLLPLFLLMQTAWKSTETADFSAVNITKIVANLVTTPAFAAKDIRLEKEVSVLPAVVTIEQTTPEQSSDKPFAVLPEKNRVKQHSDDTQSKIDALLKKSSYIKINYAKEMKCLAQAVYYEARSETTAGQLAVAQVVLNRVKSQKYSDSICGVVYQRTEQVCQFSFVCDGSLNEPIEENAWLQANKIVLGIMKNTNKNTLQDVTGDATHYHADYVKPVWASSLRKTAVIGRHIFYREAFSARLAQN